MSFHAGQTFTFGETPSATKWNYIWENDYALADGTGISNDAIINRHILTGNLYTSKVYNPYKFLAYRNAARSSGASAFIAVQHDTDVFDTGANHDAVTNKGRFTAPVAGFYQFNATTSVNSGSSDTLICLYKNGSRYIDGNRFSTGGPINQSVLSTMIQLAANDYIEVYLFTASSVALVVGIGTSMSNFFSGYLVSAT